MEVRERQGARRRATAWMMLGVLLGFLALAGVARAQPVEPEQLITMDFQDVEIAVLVKFISEITGRNFILDEKVRGKITVISPTKITVPEAYQVFQSILEVKGFTTVPAGPIIKIVPIREAKQAGSPIADGVGTGGDQFVTQLLPLSFVDASSLVPVLQPMVSKDGLISAYDGTNSLIIIDTASNITRLTRLVAELDIEVPQRGLEIIELEHAYATELAATLQEILEASEESGAAPAEGGKRQARPGAGGPAFRVIPDQRTNSIIVVAGPAHLRTIRSMIEDLDRELPGVSKINVYRLRYANAVEMVQVLSEIVGGGSGGGSLGGLESTNTRRTTRQQQSGFGGGSSGLQSQLSRALGQSGGAGRGEAGGGSPALQVASAAGSGGEFVGEVRVTADPYTNSLIISASPQDYDTLNRVIEDLDVPRRQVLVEAIILEVSLDKSSKLGLELQGGLALNDGIGLGRLNLESLNSVVTSPGSISGLVLAAASNQTVTLPDGTVVPAQVALFTALQSDTDVNILSAPTILTSDNQEAEILVGQNIPFIASRATDSTNLSNTFATVDRQDVGITLRLTPQISDGDVVRLDLYEEVSAVVPNPPVDPNIAGPTTTVRSASTTVVAASGQTVVIGGLISDDITSAESKIPFLGDIPVLGNLFKQRQDLKNKINLLIFLTPHVIRDEGRLQEISVAQRDRMRRSLDAHGAYPDRAELFESPTWGDPAAPRSSGGTDEGGPYWAPSGAAVGDGARVEPSTHGLPRSGHRYAVLLNYWEEGEPPPGLESTNGFLTVYFPDSGADFFEKGGTYEYQASSYRARFSCLEVFPSADEALDVYPEGVSLERWDGATVRWKPISEGQMRSILAGESNWKRQG